MSNTVGDQQHDPRPQRQARFRRRRPHPFLQLITITVRHSQRRCSHTQFNQTTPPNYFRRAALVHLGEAVGYRYAPMNSGVPPEVKELVRVGKTLEALRRYREVTGASLEQAKAVVLSL